jgi:hypothetical protein
VLLHDGVDIKALSEYLGHHDPGCTLRIYVHLMPDAADRMRSVIDKALSPEADGPGTAQEATEKTSALVTGYGIVIVGVLPGAVLDQLGVRERAETVR